MSDFYMIIARIFFPIFFGGARASLPVSYAYADSAAALATISFRILYFTVILLLAFVRYQLFVCFCIVLICSLALFFYFIV